MLQAAAHRAPRSLLSRCCRSSTTRAAMSTLSTSPAATADAAVRASTTPAGLGHITLCRDRQLNALGAVDVEALRAQLLSWAAPGSGVKCVLLDSNNDRSFCSGRNTRVAAEISDQGLHFGPKGVGGRGGMQKQTFVFEHIVVVMPGRKGRGQQTLLCKNVCVCACAVCAVCWCDNNCLLV